MQIYLNEGFKGGETTFYSENNDEVPVVPKTGTFTFFFSSSDHKLISC